MTINRKRIELSDFHYKKLELIQAHYKKLGFKYSKKTLVQIQIDKLYRDLKNKK